MRRTFKHLGWTPVIPLLLPNDVQILSLGHVSSSGHVCEVESLIPFRETNSAPLDTSLDSYS